MKTAAEIALERVDGIASVALDWIYVLVEKHRATHEHGSFGNISIISQEGPFNIGDYRPDFISESAAVEYLRTLDKFTVSQLSIVPLRVAN